MSAQLFFICYTLCSVTAYCVCTHVLRVYANTYICSLCVCCEQYQQHHFQGQPIPSPNGRPQSSPHSIVTALRGRTQSSPGLYAGDLRGRTNSPGQLPVQVNICLHNHRQTKRERLKECTHKITHAHTHLGSCAELLQILFVHVSMCG